MPDSRDIAILGVKISLLPGEELLARIGESVRSRSRLLVASGNVQSLNLCCSNMALRETLNSADIVRLDGAGVALAAKLLGHRPTERLTWADFGHSLARFCARSGFSLYLLGNAPGVARSAADVLHAANPGLKIAGTRHGYFQKGTDSPENRDVVREINASGADILVVGLGMPLQERWITENRDALQPPVIMTAGAAFEWIAGLKPRAPEWMRENGMEWLWRLRLEPRRLFRRYVLGNPLFLLRVLGEKFGLSRSGRTGA